MMLKLRLLKIVPIVLKLAHNVFRGTALYKTETLVFIWHPRGRFFVWKELNYTGVTVYYEFKIGPFVLWTKLT